MSEPIMRCRVCHSPIGEHYTCLDRRIEKQTVKDFNGKPRTEVSVLSALEMFHYDGQDCRKLHEPQVTAEMKLQSTYPKGSSTVPCSRCGAPVDRQLPHVSYGYLELLCQDCEEPDLPPAEEAAVVQNQKKERSRA